MTVCCLLHLYNLHLFCIYKTETSQNGKSSLVLKIILYLTLFWHPTTLTGKTCLIWGYEINKHVRIQSTYLYAKNPSFTPWYQSLCPLCCQWNKARIFMDKKMRRGQTRRRVLLHNPSLGIWWTNSIDNFRPPP